MNNKGYEGKERPSVILRVNEVSEPPQGTALQAGLTPNSGGDLAAGWGSQ